ncbi:hypothetical protein GGR54DRAFT_178812 [Hypoxylon sp. NC1633]|nr:hypothetical protein GGR54DRAFT_178812 [Hypoxylon sp. NC1633]
MPASDTLAYAASLGPSLSPSPATCCQLFFVLASATVLAIAAAPESVRGLMMQYGARSTTGCASNRTGSGEGTGGGERAGHGTLVSIVSWATSVKVPHSWFMHFYVVSLSCSVFWAVQFLRRGTALEFIATHQAQSDGPSMTVEQVILAWFLMALQGGRRFYESVAVIRPSASEMWIVHWLLGIAFYLCVSISVWIEGSRSIQSSDRIPLTPDVPPFSIIFGVPMFLISWFMQYKCHSYLSRLKKYSLPEDGLFKYLICPHYTCECALYLSLALVAAPEGQLYNRTLICALLFVGVNLGVTAHGTKRWYGEKFGDERVRGKWSMIPGVV